jgi:DNA-directed RNA polymerase subunit RPC12/RpoP
VFKEDDFFSKDETLENKSPEEKNVIENELENAVLYVCPSCGAEVITDETTAATSCHYCSNPIVLSGKLSGELKPDFVIPFKIDKDGAVTITSNSNTTISVDKNGNVTINAKGKISLKNNSANLYSILDGMLTVLNNSLATAGSPASHTVVPAQFQTQQTQLGQLMQ